MDKKIKILIVIALIAGAGVSVGVTAGYFAMSQSGAINPVILLAFKGPLVDLPPTSNNPSAIYTAMDGSETIDWILYDDFGPGQYRVWVNDTKGDYYIWVDWTDWTASMNLIVPINRSYFGVFNYTIQFTDSNDQDGTPNTVIVTVQKMWTWVSGNETGSQAGIYGTKGMPASGNIPGARGFDVSWTDSDDNLWLFGGYAYDSVGSQGRLNDLWMFNITSGWWTWVSGNDTINIKGTYGTKGVPAVRNLPGAREISVSWTDSDDILWLFGGWGYDSTGSGGYLNDLWKYG